MRPQNEFLHQDENAVIKQDLMRIVAVVLRGLKTFFLLVACFCLNSLHAQSNVNVRVMAANLNGSSQKIEPSAIRIFQGLKPDVVAIQEFNYSNNTTSDIRSLVDTAFGASFSYFRETNSGYSIPNGIISRYPIVTNSSWTDAEVGNRGFAWAQIDLPGTNDLYIVSVHLLTTSSTERAIEAANLKTLIQNNFPANAWIVVAGDFNTDSRTETAMTSSFDAYLSDFPVPVDNNGNSDTSMNRNHPHDYVLPSFSLTNFETATVLPSHSFPSGLVFDAGVYTPLSDVPPVQSTSAESTRASKASAGWVAGSAVGSRAGGKFELSSIELAICNCPPPLTVPLPRHITPEEGSGSG